MARFSPACRCLTAAANYTALPGPVARAHVPIADRYLNWFRTAMEPGRRATCGILRRRATALFQLRWGWGSRDRFTAQTWAPTAFSRLRGKFSNWTRRRAAPGT